MIEQSCVSRLKSTVRMYVTIHESRVSDDESAVTISLGKNHYNSFYKDDKEDVMTDGILSSTTDDFADDDCPFEMT